MGLSGSQFNACMQNLIFGPALFYDIPEYLRIVTSHNIWQSMTMGHFPVHPVFMGILWIFIKFIPVNTIAMFFGIASIYVFSRISKKASLIYALLPAIWIINTNLMIESVLLFFYILSAYFLLKQKKFWFTLSVFLMVGVHLEGVFWIPTIFLIPLMVKEKVKYKDFIKLAVWAVLVSLVSYLVIYKITGQGLGGSTEQLRTYFSSGIFRMARNAWLSVSTAFGSLTALVLTFLVVKKVKSKKEKIIWLVFTLFVLIIAVNWQGDFMVRRIAFAGVMLSLGLVKYLRKWWWVFVVYLIPIVVANVFLYAKGSPFTPVEIPKKQVLVQTHYLKPFTEYDGTILWIGESDLGEVDSYLQSGKRVFLTRQAVTAPYKLLVGNNYHITSLGKIGNSESRFLFEKYEIKPYENDFELKLFEGTVSENAGHPIISHDQSFWGRLSRRRVDYGDLGTWIWAIVTNHRDPAGWIYKDARGFSF